MWCPTLEQVEEGIVAWIEFGSFTGPGRDEPGIQNQVSYLVLDSSAARLDLRLGEGMGRETDPLETADRVFVEERQCFETDSK